MRLLGRNRAILTKKVPTPIPTLTLDFLNNIYQYGNTRYTAPRWMPGYDFSNTTGGYAYNSKYGKLVKYAPNVPRINSNGLLVERASTNFLPSSNACAGSGWTGQNNTSTANSTIAPDGTNTATLLTATASSSSGAVNYTTTAPITASATGVDYTYSAYFKKGTTNYGQLIANATSAWFSVTLDLTTGLVTQVSVTGSMFTSPKTSVETLANGWYRLELRWISGATGTMPFVIGQTNTATPVVTTGGNVPCTAGQTVYFWGGQAEQSNCATSYIPVSGAVTNLCPQSNYLANSPWIIISGVTATNNAAIAPDGTRTASLITVSNIGGIRQAINVTAGTTYTFSFYVKLGTVNTGKFSVFNTAQSTELVGATSYPAETNRDEWTFVSTTFTPPAGCTQVAVYPWRDGTEAGNIYIWGCQVEVGSSPSTYVPVSPAVTNLQLQSQTLTTGWVTTGNTLTLNALADPKGTGTGVLVSLNAAGSINPYYSASVSPTANSIYTYSGYFKGGNTSFVQLIIASSAGSGNYASVTADLSNGKITQTNVAGVVTVYNTSIAQTYNNWYRLSITFSQSITGTISTAYFGVNTGTPSVNTAGVGSATAGTNYYAWGFQVETGYGPNQYVVTTTTSATGAAQSTASQLAPSSASRTADVFLYNSTLGLSASNVKSMIASGSLFSHQANLNTLASLSHPTVNTWINLGSISNGNGNFSGQILSSNAFVNLYQASPINPATLLRRQAISFGDNKVAVSQNGLAVPDPTLGNGSFTGTLSIAQLNIGTSQNQTPAQINGYVKSVKLYGSSLSQNQLNTLTSLNNN